FAFGDGMVRARSASAIPRGGGGPPGLTDIAVRPPRPNTYEDALFRAPFDGYWLDGRALPSDSAGAWLRGPRPMRLITELYSTVSPELFETPIEIPKF